jgi:nicotinate dehydrogenase subunit A
VDGKAIFSCVTPIALLPARQIKTIEGLGSESAPGVVQRAFIDEQAAQCGYCIAGMVMRAQALLERNPSPTEDQIREAMMPNLCRCGTHMRILRAVERAALAMKGAAL